MPAMRDSHGRFIKGSGGGGEIGARLALKDRRGFSSDAEHAARDIKKIGLAARMSGTVSGRAFTKIGIGLRGIGRLALKAGKWATIGLVGGLAGGFGLAVKGAMDLEKIQAQTNAALRSTSGVAGLTAKQVGDLGNQVESYSVFTNEAVQQGENLLLTFTNIRNQAGANNDIFTQTTKVMADMSQALGQDMHSSAIQLGKALNNPIKGVTALQRVGVSFTDAQKKQIKSLVEHNHLLDAQKIILKELNTEFGGSAKAAGDTFSGSITRARHSIEDFARDLILPALPVFTRGMNYLASKGLPAAFRWITRTKDAVVGLMHGAGKSGAATSILSIAWHHVSTIWQRDVLPVVSQLYKFIVGTLIPGIRNLIGFLSPDLVGVLRFVANVVSTGLHVAFTVLGWFITNVLAPAIRGLTGFMNEHKTAIKAAAITVGVFVLILKAQAIWTKAVTIATAAWTLVTNIAKGAIISFRVAVWLLNAALSANPIGIIVAALIALAAGLIYAYKHSETFRKIVQGAFHAVLIAAKFVWTWIKKTWPLLLGILFGPFGLAVGIIIKYRTQIWHAIKWVWNWIKTNWPYLVGVLFGPFGLAVAYIATHFDTVKTKVSDVINWIKDKFNSLIGFFTGMPGRIASAAVGMFDGLKTAFKTPINWIIGVWNNLGFGITIPKKVFGVPIPGGGHRISLDTPNIPPILHGGGVVSSGGAVNIRPDEEIVVLPPAASVVPQATGMNVQTAMASMQGAGPYIFQVVLDRKVLASATYRSLQDARARA